MQNLVEYVHFEKILSYSSTISLIKWCIEEIICIFGNILQNISSKKTVLWIKDCN
jgi:hypothetical protein